MICYQDRWFCKHCQTCTKAVECSRPLTPEVKSAAEKWWGDDDPPIAVALDMPKCHSSLETPPQQDGGEG